MLALVYSCFISVVVLFVYGFMMFFKYMKSHTQKQLILAILGIIFSAIMLFVGLGLIVFIS